MRARLQAPPAVHEPAGPPGAVTGGWPRPGLARAVRVAVVAAGPAARVVLASPALAVALLAALPAVVVTATGGRDLHTALSLAGLVGGCALGFAVDDAASDTLAASPTPARRRCLLRMAPVAAAVAAAWLVVAAVAGRSGFPLSPLGPRLAEAAAAAGISVAGAHALRARADPAGLAAAVGTFVTLGIVSLLAVRWDRLPALGRPDHALRWWALAGAAWLAAAWLSRDPAGRPLASRRREAGAGAG